MYVNSGQGRKFKGTQNINGCVESWDRQIYVVYQETVNVFSTGETLTLAEKVMCR